MRAREWLEAANDLRLARSPAGETLGDQNPGVGATVYKVRAANRDTQVGKSGSYRVIYYLKTDTLRVLLTIYSKSERTGITVEQLPTILTILPLGDI